MMSAAAAPTAMPMIWERVRPKAVAVEESPSTIEVTLDRSVIEGFRLMYWC